ncbi:MAG: hypothetical protein IPL61_14020 [Myxococcales bacterium]|nr:hypothetical protein [Myxococcales bacterium]
MTNRSTVALGAGAAAPRALQVRIARADDAGLAGRHATITGDGRSGAATEAWVLPIDLLAPGEAREVEAELRVTADAPEYQALTLTIALELRAAR